MTQENTSHLEAVLEAEGARGAGNVGEQILVTEEVSNAEASSGASEPSTSPAEDLSPSEGPSEEKTREPGLEADAPKTGDGAAEADSERAEPEAPGSEKAESDKAESDKAESEPPRPRQPTYLETLERKLAESQDQLREYIKAYKQVKEETQEFKARIERENQRELDTLRGRLILQLLDVMDNLDRSLEAADRDYKPESFLQGIRMVRSQFVEKLQGLGLEVFDPTGLPFDPKVADALTLVPTDDPLQDDKIVQVFAKGYRYQDKVLRAAMVAVARHG